MDRGLVGVEAAAKWPNDQVVGLSLFAVLAHLITHALESAVATLSANRHVRRLRRARRADELVCVACVTCGTVSGWGLANGTQAQGGQGNERSLAAGSARWESALLAAPTPTCKHARQWWRRLKNVKLSRHTLHSVEAESSCQPGGGGG